MTTTTLAKRVHNFGAGPAALPLPVLERVQAELIDYAGTGHVGAGDEPPLGGLRGDHPEGRGGPARAGRSRGGPRGAVPAGRRLAPVRAAAGQPARARGLGRLRRHRPLVEGRRQGSREVGPRQASRARARRRASTACRRRPSSPSIRRPRTCTSPRTTRSTARSGPWRPRRPPGVPLVCDASSDALSRPLDAARLRGALRRRAEEPGAGRRHAGGDPPRAARARTPGGAAGACSTTG